MSARRRAPFCCLHSIRSLSLSCLLACVLPFVPEGALLEGQTLSEILSDLQGPLQVTLDNGNRQTGRVVDREGANIRLAVKLGQGSAEMTFTKSDIRSVAFPGGQHFSTLADWMEDEARAEDAMALFRAYYAQRRPYFEFIEPRDLFLFVRYARFAIEQAVPLRAVAVIEVLREYIEDPVLLRQLDEDILIAVFQGGMMEQAEARARDWIRQAEPAGASALGWRILAEIHFAAERYEDAFWTALHPVAFSNHLPMAHLDACYALAIVAAEELRLKEQAIRLAREMRARELAWPKDIEFVRGRAPEDYLPDPEAEATTDSEKSVAGGKEDEAPQQTPSALDSEIDLPTRLNL